MSYKNKYYSGVVVPYKAAPVPTPTVPDVVPDVYKSNDVPATQPKPEPQVTRRTERTPSEPIKRDSEVGRSVPQRAQAANQDATERPTVSAAEPRSNQETRLPSVTSGDAEEKIISFGETAIVPIFKVQIIASPTRIRRNSPQFKGLKDVEYFKENDIVKYTYGASADYNEINRLRKSIAKKFPDAFVIAFKDGERMDVNKAIREFSVNRQKGNK